MSPTQPVFLDDLREAFDDVTLVLIGGGALAWWSIIDRKTDDWDLAVPLGRDEVNRRMSLHEARWRRDSTHEHRWFHVSGAVVDLLPCGPEELKTGLLYWPESGHTMNMAGFRHVLARAVPVEASWWSIANKPTLALLKIVAWLDRPAARERDLGDFAHLMVRHVGPDEDRYFVGAAADQELHAEGASSWWLGHDLGCMLNEPERAPLRDFLSRAMDERDPQHIISKMLTNGPRWWRGDEDLVVASLRAFEAGLNRGGAIVTNN